LLERQGKEKKGKHEKREEKKEEVTMAQGLPRASRKKFQ